VGDQPDRLRFSVGLVSAGLIPTNPSKNRGRRVAGSARRARSLRRLRARRSSADSPPQTPSSWRDSMAQLSQVSTTSQRRQTAFASSIWRSAGSLFPIGKNSSGSTSRQAARSRHVIRIGLLESRAGVSIRRVNARGASGGGGCPWLTQGQRSIQRPGRLPSQRQPQQAWEADSPICHNKGYNKPRGV